MTTLKTYPNGFRLLHNYDNTTKATSITFCCLVGACNEDDTNRGIAHLAEHMFFKGTSKRTSQEINLALDQKGIVSNASTSSDMTKYYAEGMNEHAEHIFDLFTDCLFNSQYPQEELKKEKQVVCSEIEMYESDFRDKVEEIGSIIGLQGTPYAYSIIGTTQSVSNINTQDLIKFRDTFYTPDRIIVSVTGSTTLEEAEELMQKYVLPYGKEPKQPITYHKDCFDIDIKERYKFVSKDTDQYYAMVNFRRHLLLMH